MGNNRASSTNNILVKVDQNNLIYIDPNTVLENGEPQPRQVEPEDLVMYVNLEADLIPRTTLVANDDQTSLTSIAGGTLNFLQNKNGRDYDTKWTDAYTNIPSQSYNFESTGVYEAPIGSSIEGGGLNDNTAQGFGIQSVMIQVAGANFIPRVTIKFIDVRGKTLFESPSDSPYGAFFHLPWPIFYLTVKGYFGKAIKYRLHLVKFNTRFNPSNGNLEVETSFVGSTYAYLSDISLESILNAPYLYLTQSDTRTRKNDKTGETDIIVKKSTKGYRVLKSVYQEYISKGLLPEDFPVKTLREVIIISKRLNKLLERQIFDTVIDPKILAGVKDFEEKMKNFDGSILAWKKQNLSPEYFINNEKVPGTNDYVRWFTMTGKYQHTLDMVVDKRVPGTLERILDIHIKELEENTTFGKDRNNKLIIDESLTINPISFDSLKNIEDFYVQEKTVGIDIDGLEDAFYVIYRNFIEQRNKLEGDLETRMNEIIKRKDLGIGFEPTVRNIIGVVLANADTYVRLMKDVHLKAFENAEVRKKILTQVLTDSDKADQCIYPWPEIKVKTAGGRELALKYPAARDMIGKLQSNDSNLWPEVEFVENFYDVATKKLDPLKDVEGDIENMIFVFDSQGGTDKKDLSVLTNMTGYIPYTNKSFSSILYEIYERAKYTTSLNPFDNDSINELADVEFENLKTQLSEDIDIIDMLQNNVKSQSELLTQMQSLSAYNRYPYYEDQLPTVSYIKDGINQDYNVSKYTKNEQKTNSYDSNYEKTAKFILKYQAEDHRVAIYPFNSSTYAGYLGAEFTRQDLDLNGLLNINAPNTFISSPIFSDMWVKDGYTDNLFTHTVDIDGVPKQMLNTPYFHKQLYSDFTKSQVTEKYVGSAYLLLNSLPFKDLDDTITLTKEVGKFKHLNKPTLMSTIFREIGATHHIPYHMMLKWGSIYHRYRKYIEDGIDIIDGVTTPINTELFYSGSTGNEYNNTPRSIGFHPFYESVFHQIANGYTYFDPNTSTSYGESITSKVTYLYTGITTGEKVYTSFVDNTRFNYSGYTLLPTNGNNPTYGSDFARSEQENFRIIWGVGTSDNDIFDYSGYTFPVYGEYFKDTIGDYAIASNYRKIVDLIATFKPGILEMFEQAFLDFSSEKLNEEVSFSPYDVSYPKFQDLLKDICSVSKEDSDSTLDSFGLIKEIKSRQTDSLKIVTSRMLSTNNHVKIEIANPREIDNYVLGGFTGLNVRSFSVDSYILESNNIELYLGEDMDGYYEDFFQAMDIKTTDENIKQFRPLVYMYAGLKRTGVSKTKSEFVTYLKNNLISFTKNPTTSVSGMDSRLDIFLTQLIRQIQDIEIPTETLTATKQRGYNDDPLKLELYNYFKSFNDKWTAGNSIGQRSLLEEFLFLDKANKDIGNLVFLDMQRLTNLGDPGNEKVNLFSVISMLVQDSGFDIRALPAYINFYGTNYSTTEKRTPSKTLAQNMFGEFLDVDYQESGPKVILQYTGPTSKHPELSDINKKYKYKNDGFDISETNNNPIIVAPDVFTKTDYTKSNKVVAFEVSFGDQNQSIFKGIELDQATLRNTSESFEVLERLGRNETGASTSQVDIGLFNIYRQASYQCQVTCMGNVMIQPTMYFYIKNVPLFRGSYLITEVTHDVKTNGIQTTFKGTRIPRESLPNPEDSFLASYRPLFDRLVSRSHTIVENERSEAEAANTGTEITIVTDSGSYTTDPGTIIVLGESILDEAGVTEYGIPYNGKQGDKYIQLVEYKNTPVQPAPSINAYNKTWLRAVAVQMGGPNYGIQDGVDMNILSSVTTATNGTPKIVKWGDLKTNTTQSFYSSRFSFKTTIPNKAITPDTILNTYSKTEFLNPLSINKQIITVPNETDFTNGVYQGPINVGPAIDGYGLGLSTKLMKLLGIADGQVVYFRMLK